MERPKIILDVDTGTDDAVALIMALIGNEADVLGITSVNGNLELKLTTDNTLRVVELCGKGDEVPVYAGCEYPLVATLDPFSPQSRRPLPKREGMDAGRFSVHKDHLPLPETSLRPKKENAVVWMMDKLAELPEKSVDIIALGPLTNIAMVLRLRPELAQRISRIILMGGGDMMANESAAAEFNIWADPEAAEIVLQSGADITIIPLDATHQALISESEADRLEAIGGPVAAFVADIIKSRIESYSKRDPELAGIKAAPLHDALALCYALHPECITESIAACCHVDIGKSTAYGRTVIDKRANMSGEKNCIFALVPDKGYFYNWIYEILKGSRTEEYQHTYGF